MLVHKSMFRLPALSTLGVMVATALLVSVVAATVPEPAKPSAAAKASELAAAAEDLVKSLESTVSSATSFKQDEEDVARKGAVIALLANAVSEADGDAKWKASALAVRDAAMNLAKAKSQPAADKALKEVIALLDGGKGSGEGKPMKYLDITTLEMVMKEVGKRDIAINKNIKGTMFARNKEKIVQDAQVWAVLLAVAREDTKTAAEKKKPQALFEKYADDAFATAKNLATVAASGDQAAATKARLASKSACSACHNDFKNDE